MSEHMDYTDSPEAQAALEELERDHIDDERRELEEIAAATPGKNTEASDEQ